MQSGCEVEGGYILGVGLRERSLGVGCREVQSGCGVEGQYGAEEDVGGIVTQKVDGFAPDPMGIDFRSRTDFQSRRIDETELEVPYESPKRQQTPLALRPRRPHTLGCTGICDCRRGEGRMSGSRGLKEGQYGAKEDVAEVVTQKNDVFAPDPEDVRSRHIDDTELEVL